MKKEEMEDLDELLNDEEIDLEEDYETSIQYRLGHHELLSDEEFKVLYEEMKNGSLEARNKIIESNVRLVFKLARKFKTSRMFDIELEDLVEIGLIGLIKGVESYNINVSKFSTFASRCIFNQMSVAYTAEKRKKRQIVTVSMDAPVIADEDVALRDIIPSDALPLDELLNEVEKHEKIKEVFEKLTRREKEIMLLRYGIIDGKMRTKKEVGKYFGITGTRIADIEEKALLKLKHPNVVKVLKGYL